ncbi:MAG: sigma-70 family RNA polymerase sigma factor [Bacteroidota bacterium]
MDNPFLQTYKGHSSDTDLVLRAKDGNKTALEELLLRHQPFIYNVAWKMVRNPEDAKDLAQEAMLVIVTKLGSFKGNSKFSTWCYRIVVNHFLMAKRKSNEDFFTSFDVHASSLDNTPDSEMTSSEKRENEELIREMNYSCMSGMLLCLTREQRLVYIIGELFDADHNIGSEIMQVSREAYRKRLAKAKKDLFNYMNDKCGLVNKDNPCRCHKKVTFAVDNKILDAKNLLFNRKEHANFINIIKPDADFMVSTLEEKYEQLYGQLPFKKDFDKKTFIEDILGDESIERAMRLRQ